MRYPNLAIKLKLKWDRRGRVFHDGLTSYFRIVEVLVSPLRDFSAFIGAFSHRVPRWATLFRPFGTFGGGQAVMRVGQPSREYALGQSTWNVN